MTTATPIDNRNPRTSSTIVADALEKTYTSRGRVVRAVDSLSFSAERGEIFGLLGPNGAGKTTTMRMLTTLLPIDAGRATIAGLDVAARPSEVRRHLGYVSQSGGTDGMASGRENLLLQGALYGMGKAERARRVEELLHLLDLEAIADRRVKTYSGGQRRRLDVALGIVHSPEVLFLDEPSTGLDPQNRANLWDHVRALAAAGATVVLTTHYLEEADALCDRVVIVDSGRIVAEGTPASLKAGVAALNISLGLHGAQDALRAGAEVGRLDWVSDVAVDGANLRVHAKGGPNLLTELLRVLDGAGLGIASLALAEASLDDVFLAATGRSLRDAEAPSIGKVPA